MFVLEIKPLVLHCDLGRVDMLNQVLPVWAAHSRGLRLLACRLLELSKGLAHGVQSLLNIANNIVDMFNTHRDTHQVFADTGLGQFFAVELAMGS